MSLFLCSWLWCLWCAITTLLVCLFYLPSSSRPTPSHQPFPFLCYLFPPVNLLTVVLTPLPQNISLCHFHTYIIFLLLLCIFHLFQTRVKGYVPQLLLPSFLVSELVDIYSSSKGAFSPGQKSKGPSWEITGVVSAQSRPQVPRLPVVSFWQPLWKHFL